MPVAPRFVGEGVRVGSMPTPQAQPADGIARGLQDLGQGLAQAGKGIEAYKANRQEEAALAERQGRMRQVAAETGGQDAFDKWKQKMDAAYDTFKVEAHGELVGSKRSAFLSAVDGDPSDFVKDLSPEAAAAFEKRRAFAAQSYKDASGTVALARTREFTVNTASKEIEESASAASLAYAGGDMAGFRVQHGRAYEAMNRIYEITGQRPSDEAFTATARAGAIEHLRQTGSHAAVADMYRRDKGNYGAQETRVAALAQDSLDIVEAGDYMAKSLPTMQDADGRFQVPDSVVEDMGKMRPGMAKHTAAAIAQAGKAYRDRSEAISTELMDQYERAYADMRGDSFYKDENTLRAFVSLPEDLREAVLKRENDIKRNGPGKSNPDIIGQLEVLRRAAPGTPEYERYRSLNINTLPLSAADRKAWTKTQLDDMEQTKGGFTEEQRVDKVARAMWQQQNKRDLPSFKPGGPDDWSAADKEAWQQYEQVKAMALGFLRDEKSGLNIRNEDDIAKAVVMTRMPLAAYTPGMFSPTASLTPAYAYAAGISDADATAAGVSATDPPHKRVAKVARYKHEQKMKAMAEAAAQSEREEADAEKLRQEDEQRSIYRKSWSPMGIINRGEERIHAWYKSLGVN